MKLYYFKKESGNFGDDLNNYLWKQFLPNIFNEDDKVVFFGIGTIINDRIYERAPNAKKIIVFGSGVGYGKSPLKNLPKIDDKWKIYCVRGPLSSKLLGLDPKYAVTDGAVLIRRIFNFDGYKKYKFSYMPHVDQVSMYGDFLEKVCLDLNYGYINPCWPIDKVLTAIGSTEVLITEAMHGAIVADAIRVPWIPVKMVPSIFEFKWMDWCSSVNLEYQPQLATDLLLNYSKLNFIKNIQAFRSLKNRLYQIGAETSPFLSKDKKIEELTCLMENRIQDFREDIKSGKFTF